MTERARTVARGTTLVAALVLLAALGAWMLQASIPRRIVIATGVEDSLYHLYAQRYREILARDGVTLEERVTAGSGENARLIADPKSGVDVAFMQGGVMHAPVNVVMLASLYYEPLWVFHRDAATLDNLNELRGKRIAVGSEGHGVRAFVVPLLVANGVTEANSTLVAVGNQDALRALQAGQVDAVAFVGGAQSSAVGDALRDPTIKLLDFRRADAYVRRFPHVSHLVLPAGTFDLANDIPREDVNLIATEAMLVARDDLSTALVHLLGDAAREVHSAQGYFEKPREFPNTEPVDVPVSADADRHQRFGPSFIHRHAPVLFRDVRGAPRHPARAAAGPHRPAGQPAAAAPALARPFAHLPLVRRARASRARCRVAHGEHSGGGVAGQARPYRGGRGAHQDARELCRRGVYLARAHRARAA